MTVRKRGNSFMADFMVEGVRYRETFDTELEAQKWELETKDAIKYGKPLPGAGNGRSHTGGNLSTLGALFDYTVKNHWENNPRIKAPATAIAAAKDSVAYFGRNMLVKEIDTDAMREFARSQVEDGRTWTTADRKLAALSKMLRFAHEKGVIQRVPKIPMSREENERLRFLSKDEAHRLLMLWREWDQPDLHAFTVFALHTGARLSAIQSVRWSHFGPNMETVIFMNPEKRSKVRTLPMSKAAIHAIKEMQRLHPDTNGPFMHFNKNGHLRTMWERMRDHLGWNDVVIHTLRHTCASWMVQGGVDLKRIQTWLGHKRIETTLKYAKLGTGDLVGAADILGDALETPKPELRRVI